MTVVTEAWEAVLQSTLSMDGTLKSSVYYAMCIIYFISSQNQDESDYYNNNAQHDSKSSLFV